MSYKEKQIMVSLISGSVIIAAYFIFAAGKYSSGAYSPDNYSQWALAMLKFIGIGALAAIISQIVFHILLSVGIAVKETIRNNDCNEKEIERSINSEMVEDERDKLISMKSHKIAYIVTGIGFVVALVSMVFARSPLLMMHIMFGVFCLANLIEGLIQLYYYRAGVYNA